MSAGRASGSRGVDIPVLSDLPFVGRLIFGLDPITYIARRAGHRGLVVPVPHARRAGPARRRRQPHLGACARLPASSGCASSRCSSAAPAPGSRGGYLSLVYTPQWAQAMTAGRGWIALALVVFATWLPGPAGARRAALRRGQHPAAPRAGASACGVPSQFLSTLPYLTTVLVLVIISRNRTLLRVNTPACLGQPFVPDR